MLKSLYRSLLYHGCFLESFDDFTGSVLCIFLLFLDWLDHGFGDLLIVRLKIVLKLRFEAIRDKELPSIRLKGLHDNELKILKWVSNYNRC